MQIEELTIKQAKELVNLFSMGQQINAHPYQIGKAYFIRTVTFYYTGRLVQVTAQELVLEEAAWIADTGRFADALASGHFSEVEPYPAQRLILGRGAIVDALLWEKPLPTKQT